MNGKTRLFALCLTLALISTPALADGNINFALGGRTLGESDIDPVDDQPFLGATATFLMENWPVDLAAGFYMSSESDTISSVDVSASVMEATFGVMKTWSFGTMHPFVGGGAGLVRVHAKVESGPFSLDEDDMSPALYGEGGVYWRVGTAFNVGVSGRFMRASDVTLGGESFDSDYFQIGVLAGWGWQ